MIHRPMGPMRVVMIDVVDDEALELAAVPYERPVKKLASQRSDPAFGAQNLWSYVDGRDAGAVLCAALDADVQGHRVVYLSAADTFMEEDTMALVRAAYPDAVVTRPLIGRQSVFDLSDAKAHLGFVPQHSWRDY